MIAVLTVLVAFPAGYFARTRLTAHLIFVAAYLWAFTFQGTYLTRQWVGGDSSAFPKDADAMPLAYGVVSAAIFIVGLGLVALGHHIGSRRRPAAT